MKEQELIQLFREYFSYNPDTGMLSMAKKVKYSKRYVGDILDTITKVNNNEYYTVRLFQQTYKAHRVIWAMYYGYMPDTIDHIDGNGLNNRIDNLRNTTQADNCKNRSHQVNSSTGYSGITYVKSRTEGKPGKYLARINSESGKRITLGRYDTLEEAIAARREAETKYDYHKNHCTR